jgi:hypothetical protein
LAGAHGKETADALDTIRRPPATTDPHPRPQRLARQRLPPLVPRLQPGPGSHDARRVAPPNCPALLLASVGCPGAGHGADFDGAVPGPGDHDRTREVRGWWPCAGWEVPVRPALPRHLKLVSGTRRKQANPDLGPPAHVGKQAGRSPNRANGMIYVTVSYSGFEHLSG